MVAQYIHRHRRSVLEKTALQIAAETKTSDATVIRTLQALGFSGLRDLKKVLANHIDESLNSTKRMVTTVNSLTDDTNSSINFVLESYRLSSEMLASEKNREAISRAITLLQSGDRIAIFGIGASSLLAEYTTRLFNRNGSTAYVLNRTGSSLSEQLVGMRPGDILIMMAQRSAHSEGLTTLAMARKLGISTILLTGSADSHFINEADCLIFVPRSAEAEKIPIHSTSLICLEILVLALAASSPEVPLHTINQIVELNHEIGRVRRYRRKN